MGVVHASRGTLPPASPVLRSEVRIVCEMARRTLGDRVALPWESFAADCLLIRERIERVVPGCHDYRVRVARPGGFVLDHPVRDRREFPTATGKGDLTVNHLHVLQVPPGRLLLQTIRSHDQFNTPIYGLEDKYRGIKGGRRVVFVSRRISLSWALLTVSRWISSASGMTVLSGGRLNPGSSLTPPLAAALPRITRDERTCSVGQYGRHE